MTSVASAKKLSFDISSVSYVLQRLPFVRKTIWRSFYDAVHRSIKADDFVFMNLGYASEEDEALRPPIRVDYFSERLYERVIGAVPLAGKDVLEVGCGRGGGAAHVHAKFTPRSLVGVDLSPRGIKACTAKYDRPGLRFQTGDAMNLPFSAASFDAVINVESSHCYPSRERFFAEVFRVLRPGGSFLYSDVFWPHLDGAPVDAVVSLLKASGLVIVDEQDLATHVARARRVLWSDPDFERTMDRWAAKKVKGAAAKVRLESYALPGSFHYECLNSGAASYRRWVLQKPAL